MLCHRCSDTGDLGAPGIKRRTQERVWRIREGFLKEDPPGRELMNMIYSAKEEEMAWLNVKCPRVREHSICTPVQDSCSMLEPEVVRDTVEPALPAHKTWLRFQEFSEPFEFTLGISQGGVFISWKLANTVPPC